MEQLFTLPPQELIEARTMHQSRYLHFEVRSSGLVDPRHIHCQDQAFSNPSEDSYFQKLPEKRSALDSITL